MAQVYEVGDGSYRISTYFPQKHLSFNQFLIVDERPTLIHTGAYPQYADIRQAIADILNPARLAYIVVPHFEADECGGMGRFMAEPRKPCWSVASWGPESTCCNGITPAPCRAFRMAIHST